MLAHQHPTKQPNATRILHITRNLPPLVGGMERLNWHIADELSKHAEVNVIGPSGASRIKPASVHLSEAPLKPLPLFLCIALLKATWIALHWKPHIVLAGSGLTAPLAWLVSKLTGARSAAYLHGFDITVNNKAYRTFWRPTFKKLDTVIVNSTPTRQLALDAGVANDRITTIYPGVTLPQAAQPEETITAFKQQHGLIDKKILLSVGRLTTRKGLREFVEHALPTIIEAHPNTMLVIVGEAPKNSLAAGIQTVESILAIANEKGIAAHLKFLGVITDPHTLALVYESADVHVFPVRHIPDDPEGFGMVAIEAAAHGLPTAAFATGGIIDAVAEGRSGHLAPPGNYPALAHVVLQILTDGKPHWQTSTQPFARGFAWPELGKALQAALR